MPRTAQDRRAQYAARPVGRQTGARHAVYATVRTRDGSAVTFRVGQPTTWERAIARCHRLDTRHGACRPQHIRHDGRRYLVTGHGFYEVRSVDAHGRGLGAERHRDALTVPYRALRVSK